MRWALRDRAKNSLIGPLEDDVAACVVAGLAADEANPSDLPKRSTVGPWFAQRLIIEAFVFLDPLIGHRKVLELLMYAYMEAELIMQFDIRCTRTEEMSDPLYNTIRG